MTLLPLSNIDVWFERDPKNNLISFRLVPSFRLYMCPKQLYTVEMFKAKGNKSNFWIYETGRLQ